ncbi:ketopantoate reductase family protein [Ekhidna sp. To15]|uniref:ketopantoate reductase family protein n=1 Tax=Ekhidna sp. To15 TaxID=3395267 RepID=UPI003F525BF3
MKVVIYGTGGVGGYFGGRLAKSGHEVQFIARGEHLKAIRKNGLHVRSIKGDFTIKDAIATDDPDTIETADLVVLGLKSWQVKGAIKSIKHALKDETIILPLQNGVTINDEIIEIVGKKSLIGGLCKIISKIESPGVINHMMFDPIIVAGELNNQLSDRLLNLQFVFENAGINFKATQSIQAEIWKKYMFICSGGLGAITRVTYGPLREIENTRKLLEQLVTEVYEVGKKSGVDLPPDTIEMALALIDKLPHDATSSLQRDIADGRPSEIDYWNGTVVKLGKKLGVSAPVNSFIYDCLLPLEQEARAKSN